MVWGEEQLEPVHDVLYARVMVTKRTYDRERHAHFVTFSCYRRRRLLDHDRVKRVVLGVLTSQLTEQDGRCVGFVVMPDHVHAIVWFPEPDQVSHFVKQWKQRSAVNIKRLVTTFLVRYAETFELTEPIWQAGSYDFNLFTEETTEEKLAYMHQNPVRAGLVSKPCDWPWSSARHYEACRPVGVPIAWPW
jgi:putative transposase